MKNHNLKFKIIKLIIFVFFVLIFNFSLLTFNLSEANAQQVSLSISPPLIETVIKPGKSIMVAYIIKNLSDPTLVGMKVATFEPKDELGNVKIKRELEGPIRFTLDNADIELNKPFFLKSGQSQQILLRIRVPEGAPNGDYYYTLLAETEPPPIVEGITSSRAKVAVGSNILITVTDSGRMEIKSKISYFDVLPRYFINLFGHRLKIFDSGDKIPLVVIVENKGKNIIKPQGEIILKGNFGEKATYEITPINILSQSQRLLVATPSAQVDCDKTKGANYCQRPATLLISGFFIGLYKLSSTIYFGQNSLNLYASTSFIALPIKLLVGLAAVIALCLLVIKRFKEED